jgi:hypothetical protein
MTTVQTGSDREAFGLFAAHEFHQFGLCLAPILVCMVIGSAAKLVDLVSAGPYLFF